MQEHITSSFGITNENIDKVTSLFIESELKKGDYFSKSGQYCEKLSFVKSGFIRVFANANDKEITQWITSKGNFLTDLYSFNFKQRARWNMQAITDCTLYTLHKENYALLNTIVPKWVEMEKQFIASCFITLEDRIFNHLSLSAEQRYDKLLKNNEELFTQVPLHYIASMLGMSPETFSRIRNKKKS